MKPSTVAVVLALTILPVALQAQSSANRTTPNVYASSGMSIAWQTYGRRDCPYLCGPIGGGGLGALFAVGRSVSPRLTVGAEINIANKVRGQQSLRTSIFGNFEAATEHRDTVLSGVARWSAVAPERPVSLNVVGGGGVARRRTLRQGAIYQSAVGGTQITPREQTLRDFVPVFVGGVDLPARVGSRLSVVPFFRLYWLVDSDTQDDGPPKRGVGAKSVQSGATLEVRF